MKQDTINKIVLMLLVIGISALFFTMIQNFLMAIFLAGLFSAMARPIYRRLRVQFNGRRHLASATTLLFMVLAVMAPLFLLVGIVVAQAINVSQSITPWIRRTLNEPDQLSTFLQHVPFYDRLLPFRDTILEKAGELVGFVSSLLISGLSSVTLNTANFLFMFFVFLYTMYFFQMDGRKLMRRVLFYLPLDSHDENVMMERFTSVTRATIKGTLLIGLLQGSLAGIALAVAGIDNAVFWGTVMAVLSIIPAVGSALVWGPAAIILLVQGEVVAGVGLIVFCGLIVGSLDNILRPKLVGKDTKMHELFIFFGTLGGIMMFGLAGVFIGPLIASLFVTIWELYGSTFAAYLPAVHHRRKPDSGPAKDTSA